MTERPERSKALLSSMIPIYAAVGFTAVVGFMSCVALVVLESRFRFLIGTLHDVLLCVAASASAWLVAYWSRKEASTQVAVWSNHDEKEFKQTTERHRYQYERLAASYLELVSKTEGAAGKINWNANPEHLLAVNAGLRGLAVFVQEAHEYVVQTQQTTKMVGRNEAKTLSDAAQTKVEDALRRFWSVRDTIAPFSEKAKSVEKWSDPLNWNWS